MLAFGNTVALLYRAERVIAATVVVYIAQLVTGDAVNVAARLEQAADPGDILVGERAASLVAGAFEFAPTMRVEAKGKPAGVECRKDNGVLDEIPGAGTYSLQVLYGEAETVPEPFAALTLTLGWDAMSVSVPALVPFAWVVHVCAPVGAGAAAPGTSRRSTAVANVSTWLRSRFIDKSYLL